MTTARSAGDWMPDIVSYRDEVARLGTACTAAPDGGAHVCRVRGAPDRHRLSGRSGHPGECLRRLPRRYTDIDAAVGALADAGVDWIKAFLSTINKMDYPRSVPRLSQ